jgi:hypothetical protein
MHTPFMPEPSGASAAMHAKFSLPFAAVNISRFTAEKSIEIEWYPFFQKASSILYQTL